MHPFLRPHIRVRQQGQTLIIALIVMGVLLILGLVFLSIVNRNILNAARGQRRSESSDLAEAGVRYVHGQLVGSPLGADWRGIPTILTETVPGSNATGDPDAYYLRPPSGLAEDLGGPDRRGSFIRLQFPSGRALVRVRYGATDASPVKAVGGGPLRNPGAARATLIIEAVGRTGIVNPNDPTTFNATGGLQFAGFANDGLLNQGIAALAQADGQLVTSRRMVAFAPIGIIDAARFETNKFNSSAPIEIGIADGLGATAFDDVAYRANGTVRPVEVGPNLELQLGTPGQVASAQGAVPQGFGSAIVNGDLLLHGTVRAFLNKTLGDAIRVSGRISGAANAQLIVSTSAYDPATGTYGLPNVTTLTEGGAQSFDSQGATFSTAGGVVLDGSQRTDLQGFPSGVGRLEPPSIQTLDPQTKTNRYVSLTRESGAAIGMGDARNGGAYGHGGGVYVDNASDRQEALDAEGRRTVGSQRSLTDDFLNPNSGAPDSGWKGPFYVPRGAVVQLLPDGFFVQRDGSARAAERTWKTSNGGESGLSTLRYRIGSVVVNGAPQLRILDTITAREQSLDIDATNLDFTKGIPFNGVLYFEGNARVRGTIPTNVQLTLVSGATIYIDGPISKGVVNNDVTGGPRNNPIGSLPTASLMLMARDNVVVNPTMFFGPTAGQTLESVNDADGATSISPVRLRAAGGSESGRLEINADLALDPTTGLTAAQAANPVNWRPYAMTYRTWDTDGILSTGLMTAITMEDGGDGASLLTMNVNPGEAEATYPSGYGFDAVDPDGLITNTAAAYAGVGAGILPLYGLGAEPWQRYANFETRIFPLLVDPGAATYAVASGTIVQPAAPHGNFPLLSGLNDILLRPGAVSGVPINDAFIGRVALVPAEAKIEASIFAEQGSFFVIPGPWFNPNPNDTHTAYAARVGALQNGGGLNAAQANLRAARERLESYGTGPGVPFYGEPQDVRINIVGSVAENLPPPVAVQSEWVRKWGWIPRRLSATGLGIPKQHVPGATDAERRNYLDTRNFVPNLVIQYDPILATGRINDPNVANPAPIRVDAYGRPLPPMPRLPVSPKLTYFGEL